jgi:radical SAM protein with 4Fe4S-binding SPASM domain
MGGLHDSNRQPGILALQRGPHCDCYISAYGEFYPCRQSPLSCGNVRQQHFIDIWRDSEPLKEVRSIRLKDLSGCSQCAHGSTCTRCPGLAFMEGNMRGPFYRGL